MKQAVRTTHTPPAPRQPADRRPASGRAPEGIIRAIVAVTGVEDEVNDIISPGIFPAALARRRPKVVFHHKFDDFIGRVLHAEEWMPGDARLPKEQPNGKPWPPAAGALVVTMQFNLNTQRGRDAFEWARFYAESGEAQWSIGYTVPQGFSAKRGNTRVIYGIDLFEISLVLHGANPLTMALEVKTAAQLVAEARAPMERKAVAGSVLEVKGDTSPIGTPGGKQNWVDQTGGLPLYIREIAHALIRNGHDDSRAIAMAVASVKRWAAGGDNVNADTQAKAAAALAEWEAKRAAAHADNAVQSKSAPGALIAAGLAVRAADTGRVLMLQRALNDDDPASGAWEFPGGHIEHGEDPFIAAQREWAEETGAQLPPGRITTQWDSPNGVYRGFIYQVSCEADVPINADHDERRVLNPDDPDGDQIEVVAWWNPRDLPNNPALRREAHDTPWHLFPVETKSIPAPMESAMSTKMPAGSYEERRRQLADALIEALMPMKDGRPAGYVSVEATYDDHVIVSVWTEGQGEPESFAYSYTVTGDTVTLGEQAPVSLEIIVNPGEPAPAAVDMVIAPAVEQIADVTAALAAAPMERKQLAALRSPLMDLLDALAAKGMDVPGLVFGEDDEEPMDEDEEPVPDEPTGDGAPAPTEPHEPEEPEEGKACGDKKRPDETKGGQGWGDDGADVEPDADVDDAERTEPDAEPDDEDDEDDEEKLTPAKVQAQLAELRGLAA